MNINKITKILITLIIPLLMSPAPTLAQYVGSSFDPGLSLLTKDVLNRYEKTLDLTDGEKQIFKSLLDAQQQEYDRLHKQLRDLDKQYREVIQKLYPDNDDNHAVTGPEEDAIRAKRRAISRRQLALAEQIIDFKSRALNDLRLMLSPENQKKWDTLIRDSRRDQTIWRDTRFIGEGLDIIWLTNQLKEVPPKVKALLEPYAQEIDPILIKRNKLVYKELHDLYTVRNQRAEANNDNVADQRFNSWYDKPLSREEVKRLNAKVKMIIGKEEIHKTRPLVQTHLQIREINRKYYDQILPLLNNESAETFQKLYRRYAYKWYTVYLPLEADRYLEGLINDKSLEEKTRTEITRIRDENYLPQKNQLNLALAAAYERWELRWEQRILGTLDPAYENRIKQLHNQRRTLQQQTIKDITPLLTEDTLKKHPTPESIKDKPSLNHR